MAAEGLEKAAKAKGCFIKVETRGSGGAKNVLTAEEIKNADCIIVAADTKVPMDRFNGKKLIEVQVSDGISKADKLIEQAMSGNVPVYTASENAEVSEKKAGGSKVDEWCFTHAAIRRRRRYFDRSCIPDRWTLCRYDIIDSRSTTEFRFDHTGGGNTEIHRKSCIWIYASGSGRIYCYEHCRQTWSGSRICGAIAANGKSGFLGALVAGFLAGYLILLLKKLFGKLPEALEKIAPVLLYPVFGILIVGLVMTFVVEPPIGALNTALNTALTNMSGSSKVLLGIIVAGMMAVDMGGPFNKAAYVFGTASIAAGNYGIMAAVMIGGMVPPCAFALASLLFKDKFTKTERESAPTNFIMGLAFITEGAIPFAASDPLHVIPACVIGSGLAGALSMAFNCTLMAPHGGIFVFPVVGNPLMYLVALAVGTVVGALMLGVLKKKIAE